MVYGFAVQSGGEVRIESAAGEGTVVHLHLPVALEPQPAAVATERPALGRGGERILLVEDEPLVGEFVSGQLQNLGFAVTAVEQGTAALSLLQQDTPFDLLLTDNIMPGGVSGQELCRQARRLRPDLRALLMSGYAGADLEEGSGERLLRKPFNHRQLAEAVRLALEDRSTGS
jgi:CheY-like chemotaxis protein